MIGTISKEEHPLTIDFFRCPLNVSLKNYSSVEFVSVLFDTTDIERKSKNYLFLSNSQAEI
jgi:hypothetical protein